MLFMYDTLIVNLRVGFPGEITDTALIKAVCAAKASSYS